MDKKEPAVLEGLLLSELIANTQQNTHVRLERLKNHVLAIEEEILIAEDFLSYVKTLELGHARAVAVSLPVDKMLIRDRSLWIDHSFIVPGVEAKLVQLKRALARKEIEFNDEPQ